MSTVNEQTKLVDGLIDRFKLKNDAELSRKLGVAPPVISKLRHNRLPIGDGLLVKIHDVFGLQINETRALYQEVKPN